MQPLGPKTANNLLFNSSGVMMMMMMTMSMIAMMITDVRIINMPID